MAFPSRCSESKEVTGGRSPLTVSVTRRKRESADKPGAVHSAKHSNKGCSLSKDRVAPFTRNCFPNENCKLTAAFHSRCSLTFARQHRIQKITCCFVAQPTGRSRGRANTA